MSLEIDRQAIIREEFLYESAPFPSCHSATLVETSRGLLAAFFGGTRERDPDVCIWTCLRTEKGWGELKCVADGIQTDGSRLPTWNPVLFQPRNGPLTLFYKVGPSPKGWWGMFKTSDDAGRTWSDAKRLAPGLLGPIKNKPIQLENGDILSPTSIETVVDINDDGGGGVVDVAAGISQPVKKEGWFVYFERSTDSGKSWTSTPTVDEPAGVKVKAIQPSILIHSQSRLQAIGRTQANGKMFETWSEDAGKTWSPLRLIDIPNCNSGTDAVTLKDGRHLLVYNHSATPKVRYPLNVAISEDGIKWLAGAVLDHEGPEQYSYPCVIQGQDGIVHISYTWKRLRMKYVALDVNKMNLREMPDGAWPG